LCNYHFIEFTDGAPTMATRTPAQHDAHCIVRPSPKGREYRIIRANVLNGVPSLSLSVRRHYDTAHCVVWQHELARGDFRPMLWSCGAVH
jgi:hypothetical protein